MSCYNAPMYQPSKKILERYADVMVNFALGKGKGIKKDDVVQVIAYESAKPLFVEILRAITKAHGHAITRYMPDSDKSFNIEKDFYLDARDHQIKFFPSKYYRGLLEETDHSLFIESQADTKSLQGIDPKKIMTKRQAMKPYHEWRDEKENRGALSWTLALYGTPAMAREAGLSERAYWDQIVRACFLNFADPVSVWRKVSKEINALKNRLDELPIEKLHIVGPDADLWIALRGKRVWRGGGGANIPSFEVFTSPDWRGTKGWMRFNQPVYVAGNLIKKVELRFEKGHVVQSSASVGDKFLKELIKARNGDKIGEFSLTDKRLSKITKFMATTLYDENIGGPNGNTHIALGSSYHDCYRGDPSKPTKNQWAKLGFNDSSVHQDFISTAPRTVTAYLKNGKDKVMYEEGKFVLD
jgi:aminopeptidase